MFEAVFQPFRHEVYPLAACFEKSHAQLRKLIEYPAANHRRVSHQHRQQKSVYRGGINVSKHVAQRGTCPTDVNRQSDILLSDGLVEWQEPRMIEHLIASRAKNHDRASAQLLGLVDCFGRGGYVV